MNNTMCLGLFLLVVHSRGLNWDFTSEVIVTVGEKTRILLCSLFMTYKGAKASSLCGVSQCFMSGVESMSSVTLLGARR